MMSRNWPDLAGKIEGKAHVLPIRVYFEDTDFSRIVYYANYLKFCERGRSDFLRLMDVHHTELAAQNLAFAVRRVEADYLRPAKIDDILEVRTQLAELRGARFVLSQSVMRGDEVLFQARVTAALLSLEGRPQRLPKDMIARFTPLLA
jgi:acyl-CoA thioester hydrolase